MAEEDKAPKEQTDLKKLLEKANDQGTKDAEKSLLIEKINLRLKKLLRVLPFQIFILVADADGKTDTKEVGQFRDFLNHREKNCSNQYTQRMFHATVVNYTSLTNRYLAGHIKKDYKIVEKAMGFMQLFVTQKVMTEICKDLRELAQAVAEASGGFLGMTTPVSEEEQQVLDKLNAIFDKAIGRADGVYSKNSWEFEF